jgi:hypothetical protein
VLGLKQVNGKDEAYFSLGTLAAGASGKITVEIVLDGNSQSNSYMATAGQLSIQFAAEPESEDTEGIVITREDCQYLCGKRTAWMTLKMKKELEDTIDAFLDGDFKMATRLYDGKAIETWPYWENFKTGEKSDYCRFNDYKNGIPVEPVTKGYFYGWASRVSFSVMKDGHRVHIAWISGITDELKKEIVTKPEKWVGKVAELTAMEIEHIDGNYSLRHGRIENWRDDKKPEDCDFSQISK